MVARSNKHPMRPDSLLPEALAPEPPRFALVHGGWQDGSAWFLLGPFAQRQLRLGKIERLLVQSLLAQRERALAGQAPWCLRTEELAAHLGWQQESASERQQVLWRVRQTVFRTNAKLLALDFVIASLDSSLGSLGYGLFPLGEVWADPRDVTGVTPQGAHH